MGLFGLLKREPNQPTDTAEIVAAYERLRPLRLRLNNELVRRLSRDVLEEGGKKLGILRRGTFVFDNEDESSVLMDYCIHDVYRSGRNAIDQYLEDNSPDSQSDEMACLQAMRNAKYAMVIVTGIEPGVGCHIRNLFTDETRLLVDMGFSKTARPGVLLATRLLDFGAFVTTTGAALPLGVLDSDESEAWQRKLSTGVYDGREDPGPLIRGCLERGASSHVRYEGSTPSRGCDDAEDYRPARISPRQRRNHRGLAHFAESSEQNLPVPLSADGSRTGSKRGSAKPAENRRCRCGSGKMFKNCCGKRQSPRPRGKIGRRVRPVRGGKRSFGEPYGNRARDLTKMNRVPFG